MATVLDHVTNTAEKEAELHNRQIKERYEQLLSAEEAQLSESLGSVTAPVYNATVTPERTSNPSIPTTPVYSHTRVESSLFTTETLERTVAVEREAQKETFTQAVAPTPVQSVATVQKAEEISYAFSNFAKAVAAAFAVLVIVMLAVIGLNSRAIARNNVKIRRLEERKQELQEESEDITARMEEITSEEYVKRWAEANGYVFD